MRKQPIRIAVYNDMQMPLPAVKGGSVPVLTTFLLEQNEIYHDFEFDVFSCYDKQAVKEAKNYKFTRFHFSKLANIARFITNVKFVLKNKFKIPFNLSHESVPFVKMRGGGTILYT